MCSQQITIIILEYFNNPFYIAIEFCKEEKNVTFICKSVHILLYTLQPQKFL